MTDLSARIADIACRILGGPNREYPTRTQLRFGSRGSISVEIAGLKRGQWFDHENCIGGGAREMIRLKGIVPNDEIGGWLERELGIKQPTATTIPTRSSRSMITVMSAASYCFRSSGLTHPKIFDNAAQMAPATGSGQRRVCERLSIACPSCSRHPSMILYSLPKARKTPIASPGLVWSPRPTRVALRSAETTASRENRNGGRSTTNSSRAAASISSPTMTMPAIITHSR